MNKNTYFYVLWALISIPTVVAIFLMFATGEYLNELGPAELAASTGIVFSVAFGILGIIFRGFLVAMGLHFAERIGAPLLLLNGNYDLKKDILRPAIIVGIVVACIVVAINAAFPFELLELPASFLEELPVSFQVILIGLVSCIVYDVNLLLLWMAGFALLIKNVTKSNATGFIMYTSVVLVALLFNLGSAIWNFGMAVFMVGPMVRCGIDIVLGTLFWKKGFETAVLCHLIIVSIFYLIAPMVMRGVVA